MNNRTAATTALAGALALGMLGASQGALAAKGDFEKCYGVAKAGKNDCQTATSSCAGTAAKDGQADAWVYVPKGTCDKLANGSLSPS